MIERQIAVVEVILIRSDFNLIATPVFMHSWQSRFRIRLPWVKRVHLVLASADLSQVLDMVIVLIAVNMVNLLFRKRAFANSPDGMMQTNMNQPLAHTAINA